MEQDRRFDVLVVGGGINGAGIARDAAGRGLSALLVERDDLASHTSSASTKLIHGGLRYLEHREFALVRKALQERETLLRAAPHLIRPLSFVMPHVHALRPAWLIRVGLYLYDHLARRELLPPSHAIALRRHPAGAPLVESIRRGFVYADGRVDDARLVVANAIDARERGARVFTRTRLVHASRVGDGWDAQLAGADGRGFDVRVRSIVNAAGPWVNDVLDHTLGQRAAHRVRLVKGSHIDLGIAYAPGLHEAELRYLRDHEWARCADDVLWRRSKLGLHLDEASRADVARRIDDWFARCAPAGSAGATQPHGAR